MDIKALIEEWANAFLPQNLFLVEIEQRADGKRLTIFIDGDNGLGINDCRMLAKHLSEKLDELNFGTEPYLFEVSSPGADKPLLLQRQYPKHIGRELLVKLTSQTELIGKLDAVTNDAITLLIKDKKKGYLQAPKKEILFNEIAEATIILSFK